MDDKLLSIWIKVVSMIGIVKIARRAQKYDFQVKCDLAWCLKYMYIVFIFLFQFFQ